MSQTMWQPGWTLDEVEKRVILQALNYFHGNKTQAAASLGVSIRTIDNKLERYNGKTLPSDAGTHVEPAAKPAAELEMPVRKRQKI